MQRRGFIAGIFAGLLSLIGIRETAGAVIDRGEPISFGNGRHWWVYRFEGPNACRWERTCYEAIEPFDHVLMIDWEHSCIQRVESFRVLSRQGSANVLVVDTETEVSIGPLSLS